MNAKQIAKALAPWALGAIGGGAFVYGLLKDKYMMLTVDELEDILQSASLEAIEKAQEEPGEDEDGRLAYISDANEELGEIRQALSTMDELVEDHGYISIQENEPMTPADERETPAPYIIDIDEFAEENAYSKREVKYCKGFGMFLDENDEIIEDGGDLVGRSMVGWLSAIEGDDMDNRYVHVRNEAIAVDFEIEILDSDESQEIVSRIS